MARDIWLISDTHFNHTNIIKWGERPFADALEMNETIRENWNSTVKDGDIVYHLGDVYMGKYPGEEGMEAFLRSLKGQKRLILGNHDNGLDQVLQKVFKKMTVWRMFVEYGVILTHVPIHSDSFRHKCSVNIHGHTHLNDVLNADGTNDERYVNVCIEKTNYFPINIDSLKVV